MGKIDPGRWWSTTRYYYYLEEGFSLLHMAVHYWDHREDNFDMLDLVLSYVRTKGLDPNGKEQNGYTALHLAVIRGHARLVRKLLQDVEGLDLDVRSETGRRETAAQMAWRLSGEMSDREDRQEIPMILEERIPKNVAIC